MAIVDPEEQNPAAAAPVPGSQPVAAGGAGDAGAASKPAARTPGVNVPQQPSSQLSAYLNANAPQATQFAGQVAGQVGATTQAAGSAILPAVNAYTGQLYTVPTDTATNQQVSTEPSALTPTQTASYQQELGASANVPNSASTFETTAPYSSLETNIQNAVEQANLWNSGNNPANISTALAPYESPSATTGDATLDSLLISGTPGAYSQIQNAVAPAANLQNQLTAGTTQADTALTNAIAEDNATTQAATGAANTYATNLTSYLNNAVNSATEGDAAENTQILADLTNNTPTQQDLSILGVTPAEWTTLSGEMTAAQTAGSPINLSQYLTQSTPTNLNAQTVATPTQYADVATLENLLGGNAPVEPISSATANEAANAPTATTDNQFNLSGAETAAQLAPLESQAQALEAAGQNADEQWASTHFGGQSPQQFNAYIAGINAQLSAINNQIQALSANAPTQTGMPGAGTPAPNTSGLQELTNVSDIVAPEISLPIQGLVNVGQWLGI